MTPRQVLITGGSDGIGLAVATRLARETGTRVTLVARNEAALRAAASDLPGQGHDFLVADLSRPEGLATVTQRLAAQHYDVCVNNAGVGLYGRFTELSLEDQLRMMRLNMESVVVVSHAYLCQARRGDALVNTASFLAYAPLPGAAVYTATKAFVATLSETLWWECERRGVFVLGFSPGIIATRFHEAAGGSLERFPRILVQSPEHAARELIEALRRRSAPSVVSGMGTQIMVRLQRLVSRKTTINMMGTSSPLDRPARGG